MLSNAASFACTAAFERQMWTRECFPIEDFETSMFTSSIKIYEYGLRGLAITLTMLTEVQQTVLWALAVSAIPQDGILSPHVGPLDLVILIEKVGKVQLFRTGCLS